MLKDAVVHDIMSVPRQSKDVRGRSSKQLIYTFISFHLFGLFGTIIMLITVLCSRSIKRHAAWFSFSISWIISAVSYSLLFFGGRLFGPQPPYTLCLVQGVMIYAAPPLTAGTTLALTVQIWFLVRSVVTKTPSKSGKISPLLLTALLILPYLLYVTFLIGTLVVGWNDPKTVRRVGSGMYCSFANKIPGRLTTGLVLVMMVPSVVLEILICRAIRRQWTLFKRQPDALSMALRVVAFTFIGILSVALSVVFFFMVRHGSELNIVISIVPVTSVLIFGTQPDLLRVWMLWKQQPPPVPAKDPKVYVKTPILTRPVLLA